MDKITPEQRSRVMQKIRGKNTGPELAVRRLAHSLGYRFRLHRPDLPGKPDLVFPGRKKIIFVHGCFWHKHDEPGCKLTRRPKSRQEYWTPKLERTQRRDDEHQAALKGMGWEVLVVWECEIKDTENLKERIRVFLSEAPPVQSSSVGSSRLR